MPVVKPNHVAQNFEIVKGDSLDLKVTVTVQSTGAAYDLTGATIKWIVNKTTPLTLQTPSDIEITDEGNGIFVIHIDAGEMDEVGDFAHQAEVTIGTAVNTVFDGTVRIKTDLLP